MTILKSESLDSKQIIAECQVTKIDVSDIISSKQLSVNNKITVTSDGGGRDDNP